MNDFDRSEQIKSYDHTIHGLEQQLGKLTHEQGKKYKQSYMKYGDEYTTEHVVDNSDEIRRIRTQIAGYEEAKEKVQKQSREDAKILQELKEKTREYDEAWKEYDENHPEVKENKNVEQNSDSLTSVGKSAPVSKDQDDLSDIRQPLQSRKSLELADKINTQYLGVLEKDIYAAIHLGIMDKDNGYRYDKPETRHFLSNTISEALKKHQITAEEAGFLRQRISQLEDVAVERFTKRDTRMVNGYERSQFIGGVKLDERVETMERLQELQKQYEQSSMFYKMTHGKKMKTAIINEQMRQITGDAVNVETLETSMEGRTR